MKNILKIIVGLLFLTSIVFATNISIESSNRFPAGTNWNSTIEYELNTSSELKVFLNDELIITIFEYNRKAFVDDTQNSSKLLNYNYNNGLINLSLIGFEEGIYTFEAKLYNKGDLVEFDSKEIVFYDLEEKIYSLENTINSQEKLINSLRDDLNKKTIQIDELNKLNDSLKSNLVEINSNISTLKESDLNKDASLEKLSLDLNKLMKEENEKGIVFSGFDSGLTGLISLGSNPLSLVALVAIILLIIVGAFLYNEKKKKDFLYS